MAVESASRKNEGSQSTSESLSTKLIAITHKPLNDDGSRNVEIAFANGMYIDFGSNPLLVVAELNLKDTVTLSAPKDLLKKNDEYLGLVGIEFSRKNQKGEEVVIVSLSVPNNHIKRIDISNQK